MLAKLVILTSTVAVLVLFSAIALQAQTTSANKPEKPQVHKTTKVCNTSGCGFNLTDEQWKKLLGPEQFKVMRQQGTEAPFTNKYANEHRKGTYICPADGTVLFTSDTKYESGSGWPSFFRPASPGAVSTKVDRNLLMVRTEVLCSKCGSHLGHVFDDGPQPTGLRYCMNSAALKFLPTEK